MCSWTAFLSAFLRSFPLSIFHSYLQQLTGIQGRGGCTHSLSNHTCGFFVSHIIHYWVTLPALSSLVLDEWMVWLNQLSAKLKPWFMFSCGFCTSRAETYLCWYGWRLQLFWYRIHSQLACPALALFSLPEAEILHDSLCLCRGSNGRRYLCSNLTRL